MISVYTNTYDDVWFHLLIFYLLAAPLTLMPEQKIKIFRRMCFRVTLFYL